MTNKHLTLGTILIGWLFLFCGCSVDQDEDSMDKKSDSPEFSSIVNKKKIVIDKTALVDVGNYKKNVNKILNDTDHIKINIVINDSSDITQSSQDHIDFTINKLKLIEVNHKKSQEKRLYGDILSLCYTLKNESDMEINIHPKEAILLLNNGDKIDGDGFIDYWEDYFTKGKRKNGSFHFKFTDNNQLESVKALKIIFKGYVIENQETTFEKEYIFDFPLNLD